MPRSKGQVSVKVKTQWSSGSRTMAWDELWLKILCVLLDGKESTATEGAAGQIKDGRNGQANGNRD